MDVVVDGVSSVLANLAVRHVQSDHLFQDAIQVKGVALLYALVSDWIVADVQLFERRETVGLEHGRDHDHLFAPDPIPRQAQPLQPLERSVLDRSREDREGVRTQRASAQVERRQSCDRVPSNCICKRAHRRMRNRISRQRENPQTGIDTRADLQKQH